MKKQVLVCLMAFLFCCIVFNSISFAQGDDCCCDFTFIGNPFPCTTHMTD